MLGEEPVTIIMLIRTPINHHYLITIPEDEAGSKVMTSKMPPQLRRSLVLATTRILVGSRVRHASAWEWMCLKKDNTGVESG